MLEYYRETLASLNESRTDLNRLRRAALAGDTHALPELLRGAHRRGAFALAEVAATLALHHRDRDDTSQKFWTTLSDVFCRETGLPTESVECLFIREYLLDDVNAWDLDDTRDALSLMLSASFLKEHEVAGFMQRISHDRVTVNRTPRARDGWTGHWTINLFEEPRPLAGSTRFSSVLTVPIRKLRVFWEAPEPDEIGFVAAMDEFDDRYREYVRVLFEAVESLSHLQHLFEEMLS